jgi:hypothetical protein
MKRVQYRTHSEIAIKERKIYERLVIFIPLVIVAGNYGANFDFLPKLHEKYSFSPFWKEDIGRLFTTYLSCNYTIRLGVDQH